ncbi:MAG: PAS domain-containing sensor histidine kinase, partial [Aliifodinibius sp.]|nr:PAS domain-containing sensor histidine kinase [Fodinibius sp.]
LHSLGYSEATLSRLNFLDLFDDEDKHHIRSMIQGLTYQSEDLPAETIDFESRIYTRTGAPRWVEWRQKYTNGKIYSTGRDITDIKAKHVDLQR